MEMETVYGIAGTFGVCAIFFVVYRYIQVGGDFSRARKANEIAQRWLNESKFQEAVTKALTPPPPRLRRNRRRSLFCS